MSSSMILCDTSILFNPTVAQTTHHPHIKLNSEVCLIRRRRRLCGLIVNAKNNHSGKKKTWWQKFFFDEDGNWFGMKEDEMLEEADTSSEEELSEGERFEAWKRRAEAISELREEQEGLRNAENRKWEDWLVEGPSGVHNSSWDRDWGSDELDTLVADIRADPSEMIPEKGLIENARDLVLGRDDDDLTYEDRVFQYASSSSAKFLVLLVVIPWALDFVVHDYVLMPFLDRYVRTVPLAAEFFDVRRYQKLEMIKTLKVENARFRFEAEIGKSPPLSDEEVWLELRHKARAIEVFGAASGGITSSYAVLSGHQPSCFLELRNEWRLENRKRFANILSDMVYGITLFILLYFNQSKVALLKFTGYKIVNNVSDTGKAFLIILITDIFLGYHSESGWQTLLEMIVEHYGLEVDQSAITIFVCLVPVVIDACVKLWLFKFLPRLSPKVSNIFQEMKRH